jgi:two-component system chemotaxis sensor kinase CheA
LSSEDDVLNEFLTEMGERLQDIEDGLARLDAEADSEVINFLFRAIHTIKGGSGFFGLENIQKLSHLMEDLLMKLRDGEIQYQDSMGPVLLEGLDALRDMSESEDLGESMELSKLFNEIEQCSTDVPQDGNRVEALLLSQEHWDKVGEFDTVYQILVEMSKLESGQDLVQLAEGLNSAGEIILSVPSADHFEHYDGETANIVVKTVLDMDMLEIETGMPTDNILLLEKPASGAEKASSPSMSVSDVFSQPNQSKVLDVAPEAIKTAPSPVKSKLEPTKVASAPKVEPEPNVASVVKPVEKSSSVPVKPEAKPPVKKVSGQRPEAKNETIRVNVDLLNKLMDLTGEIVLGRNQLLRQFADTKDKVALHGMAHMISDLQQVVMQTRMQPVGNTFTKFNRIVRDLAKSVGKEIKLKIEGEDTELDRSILETLSDPLTHLIRNCADHGLEETQERLDANKDRAGHVLLKAYQEGGQVVIVVQDDGRGINVSKVKAKAIAQQIISPSEAETMADNEAAKLIFHAGFSTADEVTDISGRGVGMDVVKSSFEKVGGVIDISTKLGEGTKISIHLPMTLAIMSSLILRVEGYRFAVPQTEVREVIIVRPEDEIQIERIQGVEVYRLRGQLIPVITLASLTGMVQTYENEEGKHTDRRHNLADRREAAVRNEDDRRQSDERLFLVMSSGSHLFGLVIDAIDHTEEIVVKPLAKILNNLSYYAGSAILGDGDLAMVLSANGICEYGQLSFQESKNQRSGELLEGQLSDLQEKQNLLVFHSNPEEQLAMPLSLVFKVEQIAVSDIQSMSDKKFIQLEGKNIMLIFLDEYLDLRPAPEDLEHLYLILPKIKDFNVGIVASNIVESSEIRLVMEPTPIQQAGILGISTIRDKITYILDLFSLCEVISPERFVNGNKIDELKKNRLMVVEDTPFFRNLEKSYFESVGFEVSLANNGKEALDQLMVNPNMVDLVVSDIVMPIMDGYELVQNIKGTDTLQHLPVVALTSFSEEQHKNKALESGFDAYEVKMNKEKIIDCVKEFLG